ncbi:MAG: cation-translocating P-type ATPase [candidate division WOR-3 bacterium]
MPEEIKTNLLLNLKGLSAEEVARRLKKFGYNELPGAQGKKLLSIIKGVIAEPMFILLLVLSAIYFTLGDIHESLALLCFIIVIITITIVQKHKTEKTLESLKKLSSPRALVMRNGQIERISAREIVPDDIVFLNAGDRVPADAQLIFANNLAIDESLLTGESFPVEKKVSTLVYAGTLVVYGSGVARVLATGPKTEMGKIGKSLSTIKPEPTYVEQEFKRLIRIFALVSLLVCSLFILIYYLKAQSWLEGIIAGITLAMAIIPEELPVVLTVFLAVGAFRIAQRQVLTRRIPALEMLGSITVLCVDKTGTLTLNELTLQKLLTPDQVYDLTDNTLKADKKLREFLELALLASTVPPTDPIEKAILRSAQKFLAEPEKIYANYQLLSDYPLEDKLLAMTRVWQNITNHQIVAVAKGAPEAIFDLCHFTTEEYSKLKLNVNQLATEGFRILALAYAYFPSSDLPKSAHDFSFNFLGLLGFEDPIRPEVNQAIKDCETAGIKVMMITGDYPDTALNVARKISLKDATVINGETLSSADDSYLAQYLRKPTIFARIRPHEKLRIVNVLKSQGEIVAMTGDGVNDAPALKAAHIGVAMGRSGSDVAREASDLVLLDDNFASLVAAIRQGRRIFDNLRKAITYVFAVHLPIVGLAFIPTLFKQPLALLPIHILFLELIIDPASSVIFEMEKEEHDIMVRPPRKITESIINWRMLLLGSIQGGSLLLTTTLIYLLAPRYGVAVESARTMAFINLVLGNLAIILTTRDPKGKFFSGLKRFTRGLTILIGATIGVLALITNVAFLRTIFKFGKISWSQGLVTVLASLLVILLAEVIKLLLQSKVRLG